MATPRERWASRAEHYRGVWAIGGQTRRAACLERKNPFADPLRQLIPVSRTRQVNGPHVHARPYATMVKSLPSSGGSAVSPWHVHRAAPVAPKLNESP